MAHSEFTSGRFLDGHTPRWVFGLMSVVLAALCFGVAAQNPGTVVYFALISTGITLLVVLAMMSVSHLFKKLMRQRALRTVASFVALDSAAGFVSNPLGQVLYMNAAAHTRFAKTEHATLDDILQEVFANPSAILTRLQIKAGCEGAANEDILTRKGHCRLSVHRVHRDGFLWRLEEIGAGPTKAKGGASLPMVTVGRRQTILFMNEAARLFVGDRTRSLAAIFPELPLRHGGFNLALEKGKPRNCATYEVVSAAGRREIYFLPLTEDYGSIDLGGGTFEALPVAILRMALDGKVLQSNKLARKLLALEPGQEIKLSQMFEGLGRPISDWLAEAATGLDLKRSEFLRVKRTDRESFVQISLNRVEEAEGSFLIAVISDATELKSLEAQFVQSQKMQAIGELAGGVAHDFNNLLTAISGHCDLLLLRHDNSDPDFADLVQISQNSNRAAALVRQLLAFSRKQTLRPEVIDIRDALEDLTHLLSRLVGEKISFSVRHDESPWSIRADKRQLEQVLMNLVVNARDAMPRGGEIHIESCNRTLTKPMTRDRVNVPEGDYLSVQVTDEGCGIAPDLLQKVFEPFYTTKRVGEGTGLGLSTVYGIVKQSGGFVFVDSTLGRGTSFSLLFPASRDPIPPIEVVRETVTPQQAILNQGVVLLVEDEAPVRAFASRALRLWGYTVIEASSAEDALKLLEDNDLHVDLFVTDVIMPGMDGPSWVRLALKTRPNARVVFVSGYAEDAFDDDKDEIPNSEFLPKPFSLTELTETVQRQLH